VISRGIKCMTVSVGTTLLSAAVLVVLAVGLGVPAGAANVIAVLCGIGPSYLGNRRWVWRRDGRGDFARELVPFWAMSIAGLVLSTFAVAAVGAWSRTWSPELRAIVLPLTNAAVFGALWLAQFVMLERVIFAPGRRTRVKGATT
jgi:putative flippase GtrA